MKFEYYVLNYDFNKDKIIPFNVFNNIYVNDRTEKEIRKYLRSPSSYTVECDGETLVGFDALCKSIDKIIKFEEWGRCEYEIAVSSIFENAMQEKWDCYSQCKYNIPMICREVIYQYKQNKKKEKETR